MSWPEATSRFRWFRTALTVAFYVISLVSSSRCGIAAKHVERELGVNYKTAWRMLNKVRNFLMEQDATPAVGP